LFIQIEETPNPNSLKFLPGKDVMGDNQPTSFTNKQDLVEIHTESPLAHRLISADQAITDVYLGRDFITVTKSPDKDWYVLKPIVIGVMMECFVNNLPVYNTSTEKKSAADVQIKESLENQLQDPLARQIFELLETRVRPAVAMDGGDIVFEKFENGVVHVRMKGACSGCPSSSATLKSGVENMLKYYVPEVTEVRQIND